MRMESKEVMALRCGFGGDCLVKRDDSIPPEELLLDVLADLMVLFMFMLREPNGQH
jgi:hypothetical protein